MGTHEISDHDFPGFTEEARHSQSNSAIFDLSIGSDATAQFGVYSREGSVLGLHMILPTGSEAGDTEVGGHMQPMDVNDGRHGFVYSHDLEKVRAFRRDMEATVYPPLPFEPGIVVKERRRPNTISPEDAAALIGDTDPGQIVFYTGAGISNAGERPIPDHSGLAEQVGFSMGQHSSALGMNAQFIREILADPAKCEQAMHVLTEFRDSMFADVSTPAHCAIAGITRTLGLKPQILTANYDLKHEARGSRLAPERAFAGWYAETAVFRQPFLEAQRLASRRAITALGGGAVRLLVSVGVSSDYRSVYSYLRQENPGFKILAINPSPAEQLPYMQAGDLHVPDDAQVVLPAIATTLSAENGAATSA